MLYQNRTFTCPSSNKKISDEDYNLAVGNISLEEYIQITGRIPSGFVYEKENK